MVPKRCRLFGQDYAAQQDLRDQGRFNLKRSWSSRADKEQAGSRRAGDDHAEAAASSAPAPVVCRPRPEKALSVAAGALAGQALGPGAFIRGEVLESLVEPGVGETL